MSKDLAGIRVVELAQFLSGPRAGQLLAELGAEVIKIEPPAGESMRLLTMLIPGAERVNSILNRDKKGMAVDLRKESGREVLGELLAEADVVIDNFAYGTMDKYGLGYEKLKKKNRGLIYGVISGFGQTGPLHERLAFDIIAQATGGIMHAYHREHRPPSIFWADLVSGAYCAIGILSALVGRGKTGEGKLVDISMQDVMFSHNYGCISDMALEPVHEQIEKTIGRPILSMLTDNENPVPFWNSFKAADGYVAIVALTDRQWNGFLQACELDDLARDPQLSNFPLRIKNAALANEKINAWTARHTVDEIMEKLVAAGVPCGPVSDNPRVQRDEQLKSRGMITEVEHRRLGKITVQGSAIRFGDEPTQIVSACPDIGEHTDDVCRDILGYDKTKIEQLRRDGAIR